MSASRTILIKSLVKPFYRKHAGMLVFFLFMLLGVVGRANEAGLLEYQYSLIRGTLTNPPIFLLVLFLWFLYAKKGEQFVTCTLRKPGFSFLSQLSLMSTKRAYLLLLEVQCMLFLPVSLYALLVMGAGMQLRLHKQVIILLLFNLGLCLAIARRWLYLLQNPGTTGFVMRWRIPSLSSEQFYWNFFIRYILAERKLLVLAIKIYNCGILCLLIVNQTPLDYDLNMVLLFYSFGLLGHGVLIHHLRNMEETRLGFYRGLPVSLSGRWMQYAWLYFLLFIPEMMTIGWLTPAYLHYNDAFLFIFFGYSVLLLLNSILFIRFFRMFDYLKIVTGIFFIIFIGVLTGILFWLSVFSFILSVSLFSGRYYRYER